MTTDDHARKDDLQRFPDGTGFLTLEDWEKANGYTRRKRKYVDKGAKPPKPKA